VGKEEPSQFQGWRQVVFEGWNFQQLNLVVVMEYEVEMWCLDPWGCHRLWNLVLNRWWVLSKRLDLCQVVVKDVLHLWWLASSYGELLKAWLVRLALSCRPWVMHFVLELKVILVYVKAVLLVYFLYKVFLLDVLKAVIRESVTEMVANLEEGILVVFWGHWRSRCRHWWSLTCRRISFKGRLPQVLSSLCHSRREANRLLYKTKVG
jgi:hypothetical protein